MHPIALLILVIVTAISAFIAAGRQIRCNNLNAQLNEKDTQIKDALTRLEREMGVSEKLASERDKLTNQKNELTEKLHYAEKALSIAYDRRDELTKVVTELQDRLQAAEKFEALHKRMTTRNRDPKTGKIVKWDWVSDESAANAARQLKEKFAAKAKPSHRLTHGLTVKNPTEDEAKAIFAEAKRVGIVSIHSEGKTTEQYPDICFSTQFADDSIGVIECVYNHHFPSVTASEFIARMQPQSNEG